MVFDVFVATTWILYLSLIPMVFIWLRRAYRIFINGDLSEVALKRGEGPPNPKKWAPFTGSLNLICGLTAIWVLIGIPLYIGTGIMIGPFNEFKTWSGIPAVTLWMKVFIDYIISRQAHPMEFGRKKTTEKK